MFAGVCVASQLGSPYLGRPYTGKPINTTLRCVSPAAWRLTRFVAGVTVGNITVGNVHVQADEAGLAKRWLVTPLAYLLGMMALGGNAEKAPMGQHVHW